MIKKRSHRYSFLILPSIYLIDSILVFLLNKFLVKNQVYFSFSILFISWFFISYFTKFYQIYRNTRPAELIAKSLKQLAIFNLSVISFFNLWDYDIPDKYLLKSLLFFNLAILFFKISIYIALKFYRAANRNTRDYIIIGYNDETQSFKNLLDQRKDYGYHFRHFFGMGNSSLIYGDLSTLKNYLKEHPVDVIFCSLEACNDDQIKEIITLADENFATVKFIPDNNQILGKKLKVEHFDYFPVLSLQKSPLDKPENRIIKRVFDIIFSTVVIIGLLSWLYPIIALIIKLESKGPVLFKQKRNGINYHLFECYKFRSMRPNKLAHIKQVSKGDDRITKFGKILRKTSLDELPQFFNVFKGEMSVVGPRPHMVRENERFMKRVDKFMARHYVKPGITGLAQVKGYRGEIKTDEDILNRIKYDLYYIENWSFWLDIKIILFTVLKIVKGDEKAY